MEGLGRVFATRDGSPYFEDLCALYKRARGHGEAEGLAVAIAGAATPNDLPQLIDLATNVTLGPTRVFMLRPIAKLGRGRRRDLLLAFLADPDLRVEVERLLRKGNR